MNLVLVLILVNPDFIIIMFYQKLTPNSYEMINVSGKWLNTSLDEKIELQIKQVIYNLYSI
jgi:hypothetical protein